MPSLASPPPPDNDNKAPDAEAILTTYLETLPRSVDLMDEDKALLRSFLRTLCSDPDTPVPIPTLLTTSLPKTYHAGTGKTQTECLARAIRRARHEVIFVTCFWAASDSLALLSAALRELSITCLYDMDIPKPEAFNEVYLYEGEMGGGTLGPSNLRITIITCRNMMRLEQLATTPFSTTESCVRAFVSSLPHVENVHLGYWRGGGEVRQWHVKALIVDEVWTVIGSANGDRASWWGSGEINVCVFGRGYASDVGRRLERWAVEAGGVEWVLGGRLLGV
ncbi:hypothetical protein C7212DRAFT_347372 [Tuber magnatum]|uniref:PLD phosphodiesterase domain-containing protein n=1 Tax=Tuber magnatum TaxID=42249 RepID=A0A317SGP9_9PEZI|nr:hypothetical protein C7212DRAFT_347372 [Tuber magnatum]